MAKSFKLRHVSQGCEQVIKRSRYADFAVGRVCRVADGWEYSGSASPRTMYGPVRTKTAAIKKLLIDRKLWIGNRSAFDGVKRRKRRRR